MRRAMAALGLLTLGLTACTSGGDPNPTPMPVHTSTISAPSQTASATPSASVSTPYVAPTTATYENAIAVYNEYTRLLWQLGRHGGASKLPASFSTVLTPEMLSLVEQAVDQVHQHGERFSEKPDPQLRFEKAPTSTGHALTIHQCVDASKMVIQNSAGTSLRSGGITEGHTSFSLVGGRLKISGLDDKQVTKCSIAE